MKRSGLVAVFAYCSTCRWESAARNAAGTAAQHAKRTGHCVEVEQTTVTVYNEGRGQQQPAQLPLDVSAAQIGRVARSVATPMACPCGGPCVRGCPHRSECNPPLTAAWDADAG